MAACLRRSFPVIRRPAPGCFLAAQPLKVDEVGPSGERDDDESFNPAGIDDKDDEEEEDEGKVEDARFESEDDLIVGTRPAAGRRGAKGKGRSVPVSRSSCEIYRVVGDARVLLPPVRQVFERFH